MSCVTSAEAVSIPAAQNDALKITVGMSILKGHCKKKEEGGKRQLNVALLLFFTFKGEPYHPLERGIVNNKNAPLFSWQPGKNDKSLPFSLNEFKPEPNNLTYLCTSAYKMWMFCVLIKGLVLLHP